MIVYWVVSNPSMEDHLQPPFPNVFSSFCTAISRLDVSAANNGLSKQSIVCYPILLVIICLNSRPISTRHLDIFPVFTNLPFRTPQFSRRLSSSRFSFTKLMIASNPKPANAAAMQMRPPIPISSFAFSFPREIQ